MLDLSKAARFDAVFGKIIRLPLKLIPQGQVVPIIQGPLRGKRWIIGSSVHGCWLGHYEKQKQLLFAKNVKSGMVVYDIGANVGFYTLLSSHLVGPAGKVLAFEPVPRNVKFLERHLRLNGIKNAAIVAKAVGLENSFAKFDVGSSCCQGRVCEQGKLDVEVIRLDSLVSNDYLTPDIIKMDIEGGELDALLGGEQLLRSKMPTIFLATHGREIHEKCLELLRSIGYHLSAIDGALESSSEIIASHEPLFLSGN